MRLALAVSKENLDGVADTAPLVRAAHESGVETRLVDWRSDDPCTWGDAVLLHAPWDYTRHLEEFQRWLRELSIRMPVFNPWPLVSSNLHKCYLLDLAAAGIPLPDTCLLSAGREVDIKHLEEMFGTSRVVLKPAVGAGGRRLERLDSVVSLEASELVSRGVPMEDVLVQRFVPSIHRLGEFSLIVIGNEPTHLVQKIPAAGQYRVQSRYGGHAHRVTFDKAAGRMHERLRHHLRGLAYARVDYLLNEDGEPLLMELEVTEPHLFLAAAPEAAMALIGLVREESRKWDGSSAGDDGPAL